MNSLRVICKTRDWLEIRQFLIRRKFLRGVAITEENFDAICNEETHGLSGVLMREMSIFIDGYHIGRGGIDGTRKANKR